MMAFQVSQLFIINKHHILGIIHIIKQYWCFHTSYEQVVITCNLCTSHCKSNIQSFYHLVVSVLRCQILLQCGHSSEQLKMSYCTSVEPVKATLSISMCRAMAAPADGPMPGRIFTTPSGKPTCKKQKVYAFKSWHHQALPLSNAFLSAVQYVYAHRHVELEPHHTGKVYLLLLVATPKTQLA